MYQQGITQCPHSDLIVFEDPEKQKLYEELLAKWKGKITDTVKDWLWHITDIRIDISRDIYKEV